MPIEWIHGDCALGISKRVKEFLTWIPCILPISTWNRFAFETRFVQLIHPSSIHEQYQHFRRYWGNVTISRYSILLDLWKWSNLNWKSMHCMELETNKYSGLMSRISLAIDAPSSERWCDIDRLGSTIIWLHKWSVEWICFGIQFGMNIGDWCSKSVCLLPHHNSLSSASDHSLP